MYYPSNEVRQRDELLERQNGWRRFCKFMEGKEIFVFGVIGAIALVGMIPVLVGAN